MYLSALLVTTNYSSYSINFCTYVVVCCFNLYQNIYIHLPY